MIFGAADQMLTAGDIQFQPSRPKINRLTTSIVAMTSGDAAFQAEVLAELSKEISLRLQDENVGWLEVREIAYAYSRHRSLLRNKRIEEQILVPLGLDYPAYLANQSSLAPNLVNDIAKEMLAFQVPYCTTIICGVDDFGAHLYKVLDGDVICSDQIGFAAIGSGSRHAESDFMLAAHSRFDSMSDTLFRTYAAKRRAELAPGVGERTDFFMIGSEPGSFQYLNNEILETLNKEYDKLVRDEKKALAKAHAGIQNYVDELARRNEEDGRSATTDQASADRASSRRSTEEEGP
ncbi:Ntn hydrolase family protein [Hyphomonas atlantica corrig.]|uniref:hypothetical protein n=1 Tax=Hyphomonas atlantica TaxID=1280948 RepID=UPI002356E6D4|nr:hypothetical protein [Hyphomonas atlantica]